MRVDTQRLMVACSKPLWIGAGSKAIQHGPRRTMSRWRRLTVSEAPAAIQRAGWQTSAPRVLC